MILTYREAIREGMSIRMREDPRVILFGEDTGAYGGSFGITLGMYDEFGGYRVRDTPISESAIIGCAVGSAATGMRPIAELVFCDFLTVAMDQIANQAERYISPWLSACLRARDRAARAALPVSRSVGHSCARPQGRVSFDSAGCAWPYPVRYRR